MTYIGVAIAQLAKTFKLKPQLSSSSPHNVKICWPLGELFISIDKIVVSAHWIVVKVTGNYWYLGLVSLSTLVCANRDGTLPGLVLKGSKRPRAKH